MYKSTSNFIKENTNIQNITLYYRIADIFNVTILSEASLRYIERCFTLVMETRNYKELELKLVRKIIGSSELHITSELEVFNAADDWINYKNENRRKFAKSLLRKVRLHLLSKPALEHLLCKTDSSICNNEDCRVVIQNVLSNKDTLLKNNTTSSNSIYCCQNAFDIVFRKKLLFRN